jgi:poly(3-hydroxybutyrate) depolymerase
VLIAISVQATAASGAVLHKSMQIQGTPIEYEVVLPNGYDASKPYPAVLAFGGGPQTVEVDQRTIETTFRAQAEKRGYIVIMPAAPEGLLFYQGGERLIPALLHQILADYRIKGGQFRAAGMSNGGISAFEVASLYPRYFVSITGFPGYLLFPTEAHVAAISKMCIHMFVGEDDERGFRDPMQEQAERFRKLGIAITYRVEAGQRHHIETLSGPGAAVLFDQFDEDQRGCARDR